MRRGSSQPNFPLESLTGDACSKNRNYSLEAGALHLESPDKWLQPRVLRVSSGRQYPTSIRNPASAGCERLEFSAKSRVLAPGSPVDRGTPRNVFDKRPRRRLEWRFEPRLPGLPRGTER